jgi:uncharacterized protein VirK/YbjX
MAEQLLPKAENFGGRRDSTSLWPALRALFVRQLRDEGLLDALRMTLAAARAWQYLPQHRQLFALNAHRRFCDADRLFHLSHRHYLSRGLDPGQRVGSALYHYGWDSRRMNDEYLAAVYGGPGLEVWRRSRGQVVYRLLLRANPRLPHEGAISAVLMSGDIALCEMGYNWVCASLFGPAEGHDPALFIVRNQSVHHDSPALGTFRAHFQQHSPRYLCLAAVCGVALANDRISVVGIRHECQIAYDPAQEDNFRNSYTGFWESFGAVALARLGYRMAVPLPLRELAAIGAKHRRRAIERRRLWQQISQQTQAALECRFRSAHRQAVAEFA